ncbi:glycosyl transferase family 2 [Candidatus Arsenophonus nilaparvatae]|uniref:hypothetical protein n=1 Tax=Candidatus Arsenophonus nilaparvatae TaxID=1247023 RepID=UPI00050951CB|nr:hypothetical protein [Candidatus Arsenophonus nilaparvatae]
MPYKKKVMFISFDAIAVSGITVEATKLACYLNNRGFESFIDLGYDIKIDKGNFAKPYSCYEKSIFDKHFKLVRINDIYLLKNYTVEFINKVNNILINGTTKANLIEKNNLLEQVNIVANALSELIFNTWNKLEITHLVIENGTLPENIIYTKALYKSIEKYGLQKNLACFVLWRDHDLMWNSETLSKKYGQDPWYYAIKPIKSKYIKYVTLNDSLAKKLKDWSNQDINIDVMRNTYLFNNNHNRMNIRDRFNISKDDFLIARTTRIIPEKKLERDIYLVRKLNDLYIKKNKSCSIYLIIAGDEKENSDYSNYLRQYIKKLEIENFIKFSGPLQHDFIENENNKPTIQDLYYSSDMVSFLTSYDYDSYGNPIGEAISHKRCYISTSYEYYHEVYGQHGFKTELMNISPKKDGLPDDNFIHRVYNLINDRNQTAALVKHNFNIGKNLLSNQIINKIFNI